MAGRRERRYWKSVAEREGTLDAEVTSREFLEPPGSGSDETTRRGFLKAAGFSLAAATVAGCSRAPVEQAIPYLVPPEEVTPGRAYVYASTCGGCAAGCGVLVRNRDGRPVKLEGNPDHPVSRGGLCAVGQASLLGLYDSRRLTAPRRRGQPMAWAEIDAAITAKLAELRAAQGAVCLLTGTVASPTARRVVDAFLHAVPRGRHVAYDALSASALLDAHERTHGVRRLPRFRFDRADVIVSIDADFLGTWISPVEFTAGYAAGRSLQGAPPRLSYHVQFESRMSLTGARADRRVVVAPEEMAAVVLHLADRVARRVGQAGPPGPLPETPVDAGVLDDIADRLARARGRGLVVCAVQDTGVQAACNAINHAVGAYGATIDLDRPSHQRLGSDQEIGRLAGDLSAGAVSALFIVGVNPVYDLPDGEVFGKAMGQVPLVVSLASHLDETSLLAEFICPDSHALESWGDSESVAGVIGVSQPAIRPIAGTRQWIESLAAWAGGPQTAYDLVRACWVQDVYPRRLSAAVPFQAFWERAVHDGVVEVAAGTPPAGAFTAVAPPAPTGAAPDGATFTLVLHPTIAQLDGRHAHNAWLHELPDPITKLTWENCASLSPAAARALGVEDGDLLRLEAVAPAGGPPALEVAAHVQPGQHDRTVVLPLGYGRAGTDRFAAVGPKWLEGRSGVGPSGLVGVRASGWRRFDAGTLQDAVRTVRLTKVGSRRLLALTQDHHHLAVPAALAPPGGARRAIVQEATLEEYARDPAAGSHAAHDTERDLWPPDHRYPGHRWAMAIDLNACTGCSACVIGCQVENNVPVVGRDEVHRHREMHWMRIDRYYTDGPQGVEVVQQPMLCQHCENASCEVVCPVLATVHSAEGLNQQVYNRCVGTRYCANNCAYKVRRFNWFDYPHEDRLQNLVLNPDVVVRTRGVMEKCSFCVQRIQDAKAEARRAGRALADGEVTTACQQSCPARAITVGDANDPASRVARLIGDPRYFAVLSELNTRPAVGYLTLVRNRPADAGGERHG